MPVIHRDGPETFFRELAKMIRAFPPLLDAIREKQQELTGQFLEFEMSRKIWEPFSSSATASPLTAKAFCIGLSEDGSLEFYFKGKHHIRRGTFLITSIGLDGGLNRPVKNLDYTARVLLDIQGFVENKIDRIKVGWD